MGQSIDLFYAAGASNVQVVSAVTKKNRPSYIFFINRKTERADTVEGTIVRELHPVGGGELSAVCSGETFHRRRDPAGI